MLDIKILAIRDILPVKEIGYVPNIQPLSLSVRGTDFLKADEVLINDIQAPEFIVLSDTNLLAQIPSGQEQSTIRTVTVLATKPSTERSSFLHFEAGRSISSLKGIEKLVQYFLKILIQTPGSDKYNPTLGGGVLSLVGATFSKNDTQALTGAMVTAVNRTRDQVTTVQSRHNRIPPDERLLKADLQGVGFNPSTTTLAARIAVGAVSGKQAVANLTF